MNLSARLKALTTALAAKGVTVSEDVVKSAVLDIEDQWEPGGATPITREEMVVGPERAARGGDADRQVSMGSDFAPQNGRQRELESLASTLSGMGQTMKSLTDAVAALTAKPVATTAKAETEVAYLPVVEKALKDASSAVFKAETEEDKEDDEDHVEKAERLLNKAVKFLKKAEDEDEDEDRVEKARTGVRKVSKSLKALKDELAKAAEAAKLAVTKSEDDKEDDKDKDDAAEKAKDAETATVKSEPSTVAAVEAIQSQFGMLEKSVKQVLEMVASTSRSGGAPPTFNLAKSEVAAVETGATEAPNFIAKAMELADVGQMKREEVLTAKRIANHITLAKSEGGDMSRVVAEIREASDPVRELFAPVLAAA